MGVLLSLLLLARLGTKLVAAQVLALVPAAAAGAGSRHHTNRHLYEAPVFLVDRLHLLQAFDF